MLIFSLTIAWQTNVIQTSGLNFSTEKWNFNGTVNIDSSNIAIAPGKTGVIDMNISNDSTLIASVSVNVSKVNLEQLMHKRLYFYVDTSSVRNGEEMDRVWLNSKSTYTYSMFPYTELAINEETKDAPLLKWTWVYDVVGYYVLGSATRTNDDATHYRMIEKEFLRAIEYDYDEATTILKGGSIISGIVEDVPETEENGETAEGEELTIVEQTFSGSMYWGKLEDGNWISLSYIKFDDDVVDDPYKIHADLNGDGEINKDDAIYMLRHVVYPEKYPVPGNGDVDGSEVVDKDDAIYLLRHVVYPEKYPLIS